jgi:O-antigen ligase
MVKQGPLMHRVFFLMLFCLPFELPVIEASHGIFHPRIGELYLFVSVAAGLCLTALLLVATTSRPRSYETYVPLGMLYMSVGLLALIITPWVAESIDAGKFTQIAVQQFVFGYLTPFLTCLVILSLRPEERQHAWRCFYGGFVVHLLISLIPLAMTYRSAVGEMQGFADFSMSEQMVRGRSLFQEWNYYLVYIGNSNKTSNNLLVALLYSVRLLETHCPANPAIRRLTRRILLTFWALASVTLCVLLSRLALMIFPVVVLASGILRYISPRAKVILGFTVACALLYSQVNVLVDYLFRSALPGEEGSGLLGTGQDRFEQWDELFSHLANNPHEIVFGMGVGGYGKLFFQDYVRGTHNLFLDILLESGLIGLGIFVVLLFWTASLTIKARDLRFRDKLSAIAMVIMLLLMIREHSPAYLFITSLGGLCFTMIFYAVSERLESTRSQSAVTPAARSFKRPLRRPRLDTNSSFT